MTTLEFAAVRASVAQAVKQAEQARALRIESIDRQLPTLEADLMTKQQEVAALRAERERLQAQTGAQIVAEMAGEGGEKREQKQDEPFIPGLPDKRLAEKKESGPLKVGDRVEVPDGVRDLVYEGAIPPGQYEVTRVWDVEIQRGSVRYLVRASDVRRV